MGRYVSNNGTNNGGYILPINPGGGFIFDPDALAYFAQVITNGGADLSPSWKIQLNSWFIEQKANGNFTKFVKYCFLWNENEIAARTSLVNPAQAMATFEDDYEWNAFSGMLVRDDSGPAGYCDAKFNPSTGGGVISTQDSSSMGCGIFNNKPGPFVDIGCTDTINKSYIFSDFAGISYNMLNSPAAGTDTTYANSTNLESNYTVVREASNILKGYKYDTATSGSGVSGGLPNANVFVGSYNNNGTPAFHKVGATYSFFFMGSGTVDVSANNLAADNLMQQETLVGFGHSIMVGNNGITTLPLNWMTQVCASKGYKQENNAVNSTCWQYVSPFNPGAAPSMYDNLAAIPVYNSRYGALCFMYAVNDTGFNYANYTVANFKTQCKATIEYAINTKGWPASKIYIVDGTVIDPTSWNDYVVSYGVPVAADQTRYNDMLNAESEVCSETGANFINTQAYMVANGDLSLLADGRHPNQTGYNVISDYVSPLIN